MEGFIEAMDQLGKSIEVFVNANEFVCFVWVSVPGPVSGVYSDSTSGDVIMALLAPKGFDSVEIWHKCQCLTTSRAQSSFYWESVPCTIVASVIHNSD